MATLSIDSERLWECIRMAAKGYCHDDCDLIADDALERIRQLPELGTPQVVEEFDDDDLNLDA